MSSVSLQSEKYNTPVTFKWRKHTGRMAPLAHLEHSNEEHWVDAEYARRNSGAHDLMRSFSCIAEVVCVWEGVELGVQLQRSLNCKVR